MKHASTTLLLIAGYFAGSIPAAADSMSAATPAPMMAPKCAAGDPVVGVNMTKKTYVTHDQMKAMMPNMSQSEMQAMMAKKNVKIMCQSQVKAMGATMMAPPK